MGQAKSKLLWKLERMKSAESISFTTMQKFTVPITALDLGWANFIHNKLALVHKMAHK